MNKIIFCHIPKNGGSTFNSALNESFGITNIFHFNANIFLHEMKRIEALSDEEKMNYMVYQGHFGYGLDLKFINNKRCIWITFLRDPIERVISYWNYIQKLPLFRAECFMGISEESSKNIEKIRKNSFSNFIKGDFSWEIHNGQIRHLASDNGLPLSFTDYPVITSIELNKAKDRIRNNFIFGLVEDYNNSLFYISSCLKNMGYELNVRYSKKINKGSQITKMTSNDIGLIKEYNKYDIELYQYAEELYKENLSKISIEMPTSQVDCAQSDLGSKKHAKLILKNINKNSKIAVYGSGLHTYNLLDLLNEEKISICNIYDSYKTHGDLGGIKIKNIDKLKDDDVNVILVSSCIYQQDMIDTLKNKNFTGEIISFYNTENFIDMFNGI